MKTKIWKTQKPAKKLISTEKCTNMHEFKQKLHDNAVYTQIQLGTFMPNDKQKTTQK